LSTTRNWHHTRRRIIWGVHSRSFLPDYYDRKTRPSDIEVIWKRLQKFNGKDVKAWEEITEREVVEGLTLACMKKHFGQADGTPLTSKKWNKRLVDDEFIKAIRAKDFTCLKDESEAIQVYFKAMSSNVSPELLQKFNYSFEDWTSHIKKVKERTTTSPDGRHYGHFKVILQKQPDIFRDIYEVMDMAMKHNIILSRWKRTVTVLIPKDDGVPKIHRLRPLHIVEPEVNAIAKALWAKKLMRIAEKTQNMTDGQYGGRKNRQAQSAVLNKILYYDVNRMTMKEAQYDDIDMRSNYDRELARLVAAEARIKLGLHKSDASFMINFVEAQKWHVKTSFGISEESYSYQDEQPMYGLGQGIAWSGPGWLMSSDTVAKSKEFTCRGMRYTSPIDPSFGVEKNEDMFVDDTGCGCNTTKSPEVTIMEQAQINLQNHSDYVETTGGSIAADKSHYYHIKWILQHGFQILEEDSSSTSELYLKQGDGIRREIKKLQATLAHKTLGCWVNPVGDQTKAYQQMESFVKNWNVRMLHSGLAPSLIRQSYESELKSQLKYRLPLYMFTEEQCNALMKIISPTLLHSHYLNKNYPRSLLEANDQYGGLNIIHFYDLMGMEKSKFLFMHLRRQDTTGRLLQIAMQHTQLECGSASLFFNIDFTKFSPLVTPTWLTNLWEYYDKRAITMDLALPITYKIPREHDEFLMDILVREGTLSESELIQINKVRQHLQVLTLSDVTDLRGQRLLQHVKRGVLKGRRSKFIFCKQDPQKTWLKIWEKKCCPIWEKQLNRRPLGVWIRKTHQRWLWKCDEDRQNLCNEKMIEYNRNGYVFPPRSPTLHRKNMSYTNIADVDFDKKGNPYIIAHCPLSQLTSFVIDEPTPSTTKNICGKIVMDRSEEEIVEHLERDECVMATDGSNRNEEGAQAWCLATETGEILAKGRGRVACAKCDSSSLRPELAALLAATSFLDSFVKNHEVNCQKISIFTDSQNSITDMQQTLMPSTKNVFENNMDLKIELKSKLRESQIQFNLLYVEAHQDRKKPFEELDVPAQLNCIVDEYAGGVYEDTECGEHDEEVPFYEKQICSLSLPFSRPTTNIQDQLVSFCNGHKSEDQLATFWGIKKNT
jgi:ribonuclease HI